MNDEDMRTDRTSETGLSAAEIEARHTSRKETTHLLEFSYKEKLYQLSAA